MKSKIRKKLPEIVLREGNPATVILDIDVYKEMLESLKDVENLRMLGEMTSD